MAKSEHFDVAIVGGGPAGATTARFLAALGRSVVLLHAEPRQHGPEVESIPPSATPLLESTGLYDVVAGATVARMPGNTVAWAGGAPTVTRFDHPGIQVHRPDLDRRLRFWAAAAGSDVRCPARVRTLDTEGRPAIVGYEHEGSARTLSCSVVVLATGRRGAFRGTPRVAIGGWRTLAIVGAWGGLPPALEPEDANTFIESTRRGWTWTVPLGATQRQVTAMIDPPKGRGLGGPALERFYRAEIARLPHTSALVAGGRVKWVRAVDCSPSFAPHPAQGRCLRVGDAGSNVDPLSSFGLKKAFHSARIAGAVANTILEGRTCADEAVALYASLQQTELAGAMAGAAAEARRAWKHHGGPFWSARVFRPARSREALRPDAPAPRSAGGALRLARGARVESRAVLEGWLFERRPVVVSERFPHGLRFLEGLSVATLIDATREGGTARVMAARYARIAGERPDPAAIGSAARQLVRWGILESCSKAAY